MLSVRIHAQRGFGMVDMMIAMSLSLVIFGGMLTTYVSTIEGHNNIAKLTRLDHELHALMDIMTRDIRRAGSHGNPAVLAMGGSNPFTLDSPAAYTGEAANSCLTYSYDFDRDGTLDTSGDDERFGFRLKSSRVQIRQGGVDCSTAGTWEDITEGEVIEITALSFSSQSSSAEDMTLRSMQVVLTGRLKNDPAVTRTLTKSVRVRNDLYTAS